MRNYLYIELEDELGARIVARALVSKVFTFEAAEKEFFEIAERELPQLIGWFCEEMGYWG